MIGQVLLILGITGNNNVLRLICYALLVLEFAGTWAVMAKAGRPGWSQFIPLWGDLVLLEVAELPWWWIIGLSFPFVSYGVAIMIGLCIARNFEKGVLFGLGLAFLPYIFYPILGFGRDEWGGPGANTMGF